MEQTGSLKKYSLGITAKQKALEANNMVEFRRLKNEVKKAVKQDKMQKTLDSLEEFDQNQAYKWEGVKRLKAKICPKFTKFKNAAGERIPAKEYAEEAAKYLAEVQWPPPKDPPPLLKLTQGSSRKTSMKSIMVML